MASYEAAYNERGTTESDGYASELLRNYLSEEAAPGIEIEVDLVRQFLPTITAQEIGTLARELFTDRNRVVIATAPERAGLVAVTEPALRDALAAGTSATVAAWRDEIGGRELIANKPQPGKVASRREIPEIGVTVLKLSNGVEAWLKPTDFRNDQVVFTSYARGGLAMVKPEHVVVGLAKAVTFGAAIPIVAGTCGLRARGSSEGVGTATTAAVIGSSFAVITLDLVISWIGMKMGVV